MEEASHSSMTYHCYFQFRHKRNDTCRRGLLQRAGFTGSYWSKRPIDLVEAQALQRVTSAWTSTGGALHKDATMMSLLFVMGYVLSTTLACHMALQNWK